MKKILRKLHEDDLQALKKWKGVQVFEQDMDVLKSNEVPYAAVVIVEGEADVLKRDEEFLQISPGYVLGLEELYENRPASVSLRAKKNLKAIIVSKFDLTECSPLFLLLTGMVSHS